MKRMILLNVDSKMAINPYFGLHTMIGRDTYAEVMKKVLQVLQRLHIACKVPSIMPEQDTIGLDKPSVKPTVLKLHDAHLTACGDLS
ncbi:hypothetical protein MJD09_08330 [bacterium]|nr:hypothetical protein [bacterium]